MPGASQVLSSELEVIDKTLPVLFDRESTFFSSIAKKKPLEVSGRDARIAMKISPSGKFGYFNPDGGDLGRGDSTRWDKALINVCHMIHRVELTAQQIWETDSERKAVSSAFEENLADSMVEFRRHVEGQCMSDGTGTLGTVTTVSASGGTDTVTLTTDGFRAKLFRKGQNINVFNSTQTTCRTPGGLSGESTITYVDIPTQTIKWSPSVTGLVAGDLVGPSGLQTTPPVGFLGVKYHQSSASSGSWLSMDRATTPEIRANRVNASSAALTLPLGRQAVNAIGDRLGKEQMKNLVAWTHPAQIQAYEELGFQLSQVWKKNADEDLNLYFGDNFKIAGAPLKSSFAWDRTRIDFIPNDYWSRVELHPVGFYKDPDSGQRVWTIRGPSGGVAASFIFYICASMNMYTSNPASGAYIDSLAVPTGY